jgi:Ca2+-transporting ATPase
MLLALVLTILLQLLIIYVPVLNYIFKTSPLSFTELAIVIAASSIVFWVVEIEKWTKRRRMKRSAGNAGL